VENTRHWRSPVLGRHFSIAIGDVCLFYKQGVDVVSRKQKSQTRRGKKQQTQLQIPESYQEFSVHSGGVSHAFWPLEVRRCLATGKHAQRRRLIILKEINWLRKNRPQKNDQKRILRGTFRIYLLYSALGISFLMTGVLLALFMLRPWAVTMLLVLFWLATIALTVRLWYVCLQMTLVARHASSYKAKRGTQPATKHIAAKREVRQHFPTIAKTRPITASLPPVPVTRPLFPMTPMPSTPLVRVLETIDLSSTNVEHFLDINQPSEQNVPRSQLELPSDIPVSTTGWYDEYTGGHIEVHIDEEAR
jgi:hypothetical protein